MDFRREQATCNKEFKILKESYILILRADYLKNHVCFGKE